MPNSSLIIAFFTSFSKLSSAWFCPHFSLGWITFELWYFSNVCCRGFSSIDARMLACMVIAQRLTVDLPFWENWRWTWCRVPCPPSFVRFRTESVCTRCWKSSFTFSWTAESKTVSTGLSSSWTGTSLASRLQLARPGSCLYVWKCVDRRGRTSCYFLLSSTHCWLWVWDLHEQTC